MEITKERLLTAFEQCWTSETSSTPSEWSEAEASRGQCVSTALVAQDYLGGNLQKLTTVFNGREESHYRNVLDDGTIFDASRSQYPRDQDLHIVEVTLTGFSSIREKRLSETKTLHRYELLRQRVGRSLSV